MSDSAILCEHLTKRFRRRLRSHTAVNGLDLAVPAGSVFALLGPNGAGKTTTIQMLLGLLRPTGGHATVLGGSISSRDVRRRIGYVPEKFQLPGYLKARELLQAHAELAQLPRGDRSARITQVLEQVGLTDRAGDRIKGYSKGMQQRLSIGIALLGRPQLLILDEPTSALDPIGRREVRDLVRQVHAEGMTVVLNSHILAEVETVCDEVAILRRGTLVHQGPISQLATSEMHVTARVAAWNDTIAGAVGPLVEALHVERPSGGADGVVVVSFELAAEGPLPAISRAIIENGGDLFSLEPRRENLEELTWLYAIADPTHEFNKRLPLRKGHWVGRVD